MGNHNKQKITWFVLNEGNIQLWCFLLIGFLRRKRQKSESGLIWRKDFQQYSSIFKHPQNNNPNRAFARKKAFLMCLSIFLYFVVIFFFFFFLLSAAAWALPCRKAQYGSVCKSESGGHKAEKSENHPAKFSARWLPAGIIWGLEFFFPPIILSPFPAWWASWNAEPQHCCWHNHSGTAVTALLAWHLLLSRQCKGEWEKEDRAGRENMERKRQNVMAGKIKCRNFQVVKVLKTPNFACCIIAFLILRLKVWFLQSAHFSRN